MKDQDKTRDQLISELQELRQRLALLAGVDLKRRRAEEELARSKAMLTAAIECLPFDFYALDQQGRCILQNAVSRKYYGDALGKNADEVCPDERVCRVWIDGVRRAMAGEKVQEEVELTLGGERRCFSSFVAPIQSEGTLYGALGVNVDITARRRAEQALRENEGRYRALAESTKDVIYILDRQGRLLYANQAAAGSIGIRASELVGKAQADLFPPDIAQAHLERIERVFATGEALEGDELFHFGQEQIWLRVHLRPLRDEDGRITAAMGVCHNITERRRAEEELQKAHDELEHKVQERTAKLSAANEQLRIFQQFAEASGQGFSMADLAGHLLYLNPALCRMLAEDRPQERIGQHLSIYYPEEANRTRETERFPALMREGYWQGELPMLSRQGQLIPTWHNTFLIRDENGKPLRIAVVITDISDRKRAEEAIRQSHDELRAIYENIGDGLLVADRETFRIVRANAAICTMLGYSEDELLSKSIADLHPQDALADITGAIRSDTLGQLPAKANVPMLRKDGGIFYADITGDTFMYHGKPCSLGVFRDVTERRQAQQALERERRTLEHMLQASDHERQLIAYDIHDGLAQYLTGAIMQLEHAHGIREDRPEDSETAYKAGMEMLRQSHFEARRLISGVRPPILDESGVVAAIAHLVYDVRSQKGPKVQFRSKVDFGRLTPTLENCIYRIAQEGLTNACKHSQSKSVSLGLVQRGEQVRITVQDQGIGFDPKTVAEGRFGLEGIRERARLLGGKAAIRSQPGKGTRIAVDLPVVPRKESDE